MTYKLRPKRVDIEVRNDMSLEEFDAQCEAVFVAGDELGRMIIVDKAALDAVESWPGMTTTYRFIEGKPRRLEQGHYITAFGVMPVVVVL